MMTEGWRNGHQVQPRSPDNLAEVGWTDLILEVATTTFLLFEPLPYALFLSFADCKINSNVVSCIIQITSL